MRPISWLPSAKFTANLWFERFWDLCFILGKSGFFWVVGWGHFRKVSPFLFHFCFFFFTSCCLVVLHDKCSSFSKKNKFWINQLFCLVYLGELLKFQKNWLTIHPCVVHNTSDRGKRYGILVTVYQPSHVQHHFNAWQIFFSQKIIAFQQNNFSVADSFPHPFV